MPYADPDRKREYQREWIAQRRSEWIDIHGPCVDCGSWDDLQIDHVNPATKVTHRVFSWAQARRDAELAKCVVRCMPCHNAKTVDGGERAWGEENGGSKLTEGEVREIRRSSLPKRQLGRIYGVDEKTIRQIKLGNTWYRLI